MITPIATKPILAMLKGIKLIQSLSDAELQQLLSLGELTHYEAHTNVLIEGELSWGLYLILKGSLRRLKTNKLTGQNHEVGQLKAGNFFGEMSLIDSNPRSATLCTMTQCELFFISKPSFNHFIDQSQDLKLRFYIDCVQTIVARLRELDDNYVVSQHQLWQSILKKEAS